ncbi:DNA polymerase-4 [Geosporobacter subterraneus DSM 17957]|uniref:DNA polymerase IV n=1 Tax=Geosporobacter subterraneus DSM 17957 TaxID=1121919 RepID=A0A1M6I7K0_9FIRM|nr:DNA polymerase IV [Geosporobacter subterraneus]SHJ30353.1 DNA polymerase-4 [Geosporobacter subterraneus DSM 17957]
MKKNTKRIIFHIDVNSAFLSWEAVYRLQQGETLDLRTIPSVVGGDPKSRRGIVLAKSIPAKHYKIQTGETLYAALEKCPHLKIVSPSYGLYVRCSNAMVEILKEYSPIVQRFSADECFLDYTGMEPHFGEPEAAARRIKNHIYRELGFTVNIGISTNKLLAKMASDFKKPDQVHTLFPWEIPKKMWPLPVEELFMVGRATVPKLHKMRIFTIGDLANYDPVHIRHRLKSHGIMIWQYANGIEDSAVRGGNAIEMKGIGNSTTIAFDVEDRKTAHKILLSLTETVAMRLRDAGYCCRLVAISIKNSDFYTYSHQRKLLAATDATGRIYQTVREIFDEVWQGEKIRHLGVRVSDFCSNEFFQHSLFDEADLEKTRALDQTIDRIRLKYGTKSVMRASFLYSDIKPLSGGVGQDDFPPMSSIL